MVLTLLCISHSWFVCIVFNIICMSITQKCTYVTISLPKFLIFKYLFDISTKIPKNIFQKQGVWNFISYFPPSLQHSLPISVDGKFHFWFHLLPPWLLPSPWLFLSLFPWPTGSQSYIISSTPLFFCLLKQGQQLSFWHSALVLLMT